MEIKLPEERSAIYSTCGKDDLLKEMEFSANAMGKELYPLKVTMPCGECYCFNNRWEFPRTSLRCKCDKHFVIRYFLH